MIGVVATPDDLPIVREFFELFKTPWEPAVRGRDYAVVLSAGKPVDGFHAEAFLIYGSHALEIDNELGIPIRPLDDVADVHWRETTLPVYCGLGGFDASDTLLVHEKRAVAYRSHARSARVRRVGYDLFDEVRHLLTQGQPKERAATPSLDLHIALLRELLLDLGVPFVEIPPRPDGHEFICCLTHDLDFFGLRRHPFDETLLGFAARASAGTLAGVLRGRRTLAEAARNFGAFLSLPLVMLRLRRDPWQPFRDYAAADRGHRSTFFVVPFKDKPGTAPDGTVPSRRRVRYAAREIRNEAAEALANGNELGVHGLDAWRDAAAGRRELSELSALTGSATAGIRMHWLYFDDDSPRKLEEAGFAYDSSCGYNDAIGYRAGTSQVFRLPRAKQLLELPLAIMDSAMLFDERMALSQEDAAQRCRGLVANARRHGGAVVINWHDRSLAPERLWGRCYEALLSEVEASGAWFATAGQAVEWYRWRRSIRFCADGSDQVRVITGERPASLPAARISVHRPSSGAEPVQELRLDHDALLNLQ